jgi:hypothetical protein
VRPHGRTPSSPPSRTTQTNRYECEEACSRTDTVLHRTKDPYAMVCTVEGRALRSTDHKDGKGARTSPCRPPFSCFATLPSPPSCPAHDHPSACVAQACSKQPLAVLLASQQATCRSPQTSVSWLRDTVRRLLSSASPQTFMTHSRIDEAWLRRTGPCARRACEVGKYCQYGYSVILVFSSPRS